VGSQARVALGLGVVAGVVLLMGVAGGAGAMAYTEKRGGLLDGLTPRTREAALKLAQLAAAEGLPDLMWTSGRRSTIEQAGAMLYKLQKWGPDELFSVYKSSRSTIDRLLAAPRTPAAWASILADAPPLSKHLAGEAVDVRRWGFTAEQLYRLGELAIAAGFGRALLEKDHLHLQL